MSKHTPGDWIRDGLTIYALHHNGDYKKGEPVLVNRFSARVEAYVAQGGTLEEAEANARLIAAAPDLLEALRGYVAASKRVIATGYKPDPAKAKILNDACAAIAKAEATS